MKPGQIDRKVGNRVQHVRDVVAILPIATGFEKGLIYQVFCLVKLSTVTVLVIDDMMLNSIISLKNKSAH